MGGTLLADHMPIDRPLIRARLVLRVAEVSPGAKLPPLGPNKYRPHPVGVCCPSIEKVAEVSGARA